MGDVGSRRTARRLVVVLGLACSPLEAATPGAEVPSPPATVQRSPQDLRRIDAFALTAYADPRGDDVEARAEAVAVARAFGERSELVLGKAATEPALMASLSQSGVLHIAVPVFVDAGPPSHSVLRLARSPTGDGALTVAELQAATVRRELVVLSTGVDDVGRILVDRGARAVVGTRRPIPHELARPMFERFYGELLRGATVAEAVQAADGDELAAGGGAELVVRGDGQTRVRSRPRGRRPRPLLGGAIALGGLLLAGVILGATRRR